jgi:tetratricopeptide (TPR) repeat protein
VVALANTPDVPAAKKDDALARLQKGDAQGAKAIFQEILDRKAAEGAAANNEAAEAARHLGALAFYDNTQEALAAYQKAVVLDPSDASGWNELGLLLLRVGQLKEAGATQLKALELDEALGSQEGMAADYGNLGIVYEDRGDLVQAEAMYKKALALYTEVGSTARRTKVTRYAL